MEIEVKRVVRFEGKYCGEGDKDCDYEGLSLDNILCACHAFHEEVGGGPADLDGDPENEDRLFRCGACFEQYKEKGKK